MKKDLLILSKLLNHENTKITAAYLGMTNPCRSNGQCNAQDNPQWPLHDNFS